MYMDMTRFDAVLRPFGPDSYLYRDNIPEMHKTLTDDEWVIDLCALCQVLTGSCSDDTYDALNDDDNWKDTPCKIVSGDDDMTLYVIVSRDAIPETLGAVCAVVMDINGYGPTNK